MCAYVINIIVVLIIFPVILQTDINVIMLSIGGQGAELILRPLLKYHYDHSNYSNNYY